MVRIKFCGITNLQSAKSAIEAGADAIGFVFTNSKREVTPEQAKHIISQLPPFVTAVGVFVDERLELVNEIANFCQLDFIQLHGSESSEYCRLVERPVVKSIKVRNAGDLEDMHVYAEAVRGILFDSHVHGKSGGTGKSFPWEHIVSIQDKSKVILAGGLNVDNIEEAILKTRPYAVDVSSGIETNNVKDPLKMHEFVNRVRNCVMKISSDK
ncbi:phosphoribosylanthranilate isomerase [Bacillus sp. WMMC1349]|uniref:phosphoribosylanthranilate isomerase n=1 Tax=Bacillus sp. WMMC1349 TaxID=2736254 RepID=UPI0015562517|nr:phosphoribosylanthranilate isomerase [Bacillus sp. WMMC1349]NPC91333.1 phosphoribosylanthranilate isomerase [Bacillus sp. WMMC1349]